MSLPNPGMSFTPFDILPASDLNDIVENVEALADGTGLNTGAITAAKIDAGAVTPEKLVSGAGTSWTWQTWTPSLSNLSGGTLNYARYVRTGDTIIFRFKYTLAGTGVGTSPTVSVPVNIHADYLSTEPIMGQVIYLDAGNNVYSGILLRDTSSTISFRPNRADTTFLTSGGGTSATAPFTFGSGDIIYLLGSYQAA